MQICQENGVQIALNLLSFPGITDRERELEALLACIRKYKISMVQLRNLNIDPQELFSRLEPGGEVMGITNFISIIRQELPRVQIGSYSHPVR